LQRSGKSQNATENKLLYVKLGQVYEQAFVDKVAPYIGLKAIINPEKATNPYTYDLIVEGKPADLKHQQTCFWLSKAKFGIAPEYCVSFNLKDYLRYKSLYGDIGLMIYFWVERTQTQAVFGSKTYSCPALHGVWEIEFTKLANLIEAGELPLHEYERRKDDTRGNAKASYVLDVREGRCIAAYTKLPDKGFLSSQKMAA
jgi:hypothetical protein